MRTTFDASGDQFSALLWLNVDSLLENLFAFSAKAEGQFIGASCMGGGPGEDLLANFNLNRDLHPDMNRSAARKLLERRTCAVEALFFNVLRPLKVAQNNLTDLYQLPDEILVKIAMYLPQKEARRFATTSYRIYDVISCVTSFWTEIDLSNSDRWVSTILQRSGNQPLVVKAASLLNYLGPEIPGSRDRLSMDAFIDLMPRIGTLQGSIGGRLTYYLNFKSLAMPAPVLQNLHLSTEFQLGTTDLLQLPSPLFGGQTPLLREVTFQGQYANFNDPIYKNLTSIYVSTGGHAAQQHLTTLKSLASMLQRCPRLESLALCNVIRFPSTPIDPSDETPSAVSLPHLRSLHLDQSEGLELLMGVINPQPYVLKKLRLRASPSVFTFRPCPAITHLMSDVRTINFRSDQSGHSFMGATEQDGGSSNHHQPFNLLIDTSKPRFGHNTGINGHRIPFENDFNWDKIWKIEFSGRFSDQFYLDVLQRCRMVKVMILPVCTNNVQLLQRILPSDLDRAAFLEEIRFVAPSTVEDALIDWIQDRKTSSKVSSIKKLLLTHWCADRVSYSQNGLDTLKNLIGEGFQFVDDLHWDQAMSQDWSSDRLFDARLFRDERG